MGWSWTVRHIVFVLFISLFMGCCCCYWGLMTMWEWLILSCFFRLGGDCCCCCWGCWCWCFTLIVESRLRMRLRLCCRLCLGRVFSSKLTLWTFCLFYVGFDYGLLTCAKIRLCASITVLFTNRVLLVWMSPCASVFIMWMSARLMPNIHWHP